MDKEGILTELKMVCSILQYCTAQHHQSYNMNREIFSTLFHATDGCGVQISNKNHICF